MNRAGVAVPGRVSLAAAILLAAVVAVLGTASSLSMTLYVVSP